MNHPELRSLRAELESDLSDLEAVVREIQETRKSLPTPQPTHKDKAALGAFLHSF